MHLHSTQLGDAALHADAGNAFTRLRQSAYQLVTIFPLLYRINCNANGLAGRDRNHSWRRNVNHLTANRHHRAISRLSIFNQILP